MDLMGTWGYEGYVGLRITCRGMRDCGDMRDMRDMRDGPPTRNHPGRAAVFWSHPPLIHEDGKQERQTICEPKKECLFCI
jgi:hypothetical protein